MSFTTESSGHMRRAYHTAKGDREGNGEAKGRGWKAHLRGRTARLLGGRLHRRRGGGGGAHGRRRRSEPHAPFSPGLPTKVKREGGRERGVGGSEDGRRRRMGGGGGRRVGCWEGLGLGEWMDIYWTLSAS
jgi:hypothetical protein